MSGPGPQGTGTAPPRTSCLATEMVSLRAVSTIVQVAVLATDLWFVAGLVTEVAGAMV